MTGEPIDRAGILRPYLPRLAIEWLARYPNETFREIDGTLVIRRHLRLHETVRAARAPGARSEPKS